MEPFSHGEQSGEIFSAVATAAAFLRGKRHLNPGAPKAVGEEAKKTGTEVLRVSFPGQLKDSIA